MGREINRHTNIHTQMNQKDPKLIVFNHEMKSSLLRAIVPTYFQLFGCLEIAEQF